MSEHLDLPTLLTPVNETAYAPLYARVITDGADETIGFFPVGTVVAMSSLESGDVAAGDTAMIRHIQQDITRWNDRLKQLDALGDGPTPPRWTDCTVRHKDNVQHGGDGGGFSDHTTRAKAMHGALADRADTGRIQRSRDWHSARKERRRNRG
jgi:hypothetical protein